MSDTGGAMLAMLEYARPLAEQGDFAGLRHILDGIRVDREVKARHLVEASYAESLQGRYRNARTAAVMAYCLHPVDIETRRQLAARLRTTNDAALLRDLIARSGPLDRIPIPLLLTYAAQLSYLNLQEAALPFLDEARRADPDYPPTLLSRGQVLTYLGRIDEAVREFERCIGVAPQIGQAHWFLAHVRKATGERNNVARLRAQLARPGLPVHEEISLAFALHKELDDLGDHATAWQALQRACRAKRGTLNYRSADTSRLVDALMAIPDGPTAATPDPAAPTPLFIVGMHRSGTTLLEQLLDGSPDVRGVGELYDFTSAMRYATDHHCRGVIDLGIVERSPGVDLAEVGRRYLAGMAWRLDEKRFFTDKLPSNFLNIGYICRALPGARILHMVRDPMETCFSNLRELFSDANPYSYDQQELAHFHGEYRRLMAHWHARFPGRILDVDYAELTRSPEATMRRVAAFCGLDYVPAMQDPRSSRRAVATASAVQVRDGVVRRETPKWTPYAPFLGALMDGLEADAGASPQDAV
ncbi:sulfotransferase [Thermomonas sp.]|uniref:tetratricopeptide repeat-containing sulfotransferase family protein n=1 Tax=Thermomonas sp. TaxID=1971895 RepID=UPI0039194813